MAFSACTIRFGVQRLFVVLERSKDLKLQVLSKGLRPRWGKPGPTHPQYLFTGKLGLESPGAF